MIIDIHFFKERLSVEEKHLLTDIDSKPYIWNLLQTL
jgi:hypothetical protein